MTASQLAVQDSVLEAPPEARNVFRLTTATTPANQKLLRALLHRLGWQEEDVQDPKKKMMSPRERFQLWWARIDELQADSAWGWLHPWQLVNHFPRSQAIHNKSRLVANLRWYYSTVVRQGQVWDICPETYDLESSEELKAFLVDFAVGRAVSALRQNMHKFDNQKEEGAPTDETMRNIAIAVRMLGRLTQQARQARQGLYGATEKGKSQLLDHASRFAPEELEMLIAPSSLFASNAQNMILGSIDKLTVASLPLEGRKWLDALSQTGGDAIGNTALGCVATAWLLKVPVIDKGAGVHVHSNLVPLLLEAKKKQWRVVIQRYISQPLLVEKRKCDLRLWLLVTSWSPAVCWAYPKPYFRIASQPFDPSAGCIANRRMHITNADVQQIDGKPEEMLEADEEFRWSFEKFFAWAEHGALDMTNSCKADGELPYGAKCSARERWDNYTWPRILESVRTSVLACQAEVGEHPDGCFELFGVDFLLDASMRPWLLEINVYPSLCQDAGPSLRTLVDSMLAEMVELVTGLRKGTIDLHQRYGKLDETVDGSGHWRLLLREYPTSCKGNRLRLQRQSTLAVEPSLGVQGPRDHQTRVLREWMSGSLDMGIPLSGTLRQLVGTGRYKSESPDLVTRCSRLARSLSPISGIRMLPKSRCRSTDERAQLNNSQNNDGERGDRKEAGRPPIPYSAPSRTAPPMPRPNMYRARGRSQSADWNPIQEAVAGLDDLQRDMVAKLKQQRNRRQTSAGRS